MVRDVMLAIEESRLWEPTPSSYLEMLLRVDHPHRRKGAALGIPRRLVLEHWLWCVQKHRAGPNGQDKEVGFFRPDKRSAGI